MNFNKTYLGVGFHSKFENGRKGGDLSFDGHSLVFKTESETIRFDLYGIELERGGASNALIYFKHKSHPDWVFYTSDKTILKEPVLKEYPQTREFLKHVNTKNGIFAAVALSIVMVIALLIFGIFSTKSFIVKYMASKVPVNYEKELGDKMLPMATAGKAFIQDSVLLSHLDIITDSLQKAVNDTNFKFTFYLINDSELNAFALPGGHVVINSGLIQNSDSYEELAGVVAHEIAHVTLRHHVRGIINNVGIMALLGGFVGGDAGFYSTILYGGAQLSLLNYSRDMENESDNQGFDYLAASKIDPQGMITFFKTLQKQHEKDMLSKEAESAMSFFSTHPETEERIANLEKRLISIDRTDFKPISADYSSFKKAVTDHLSK